MPVVADLGKAQFRITGDDFAPSDIAWLRAEENDKRAYWSNLAVLARDAKYLELSKGLGVNGQRLPTRKRPRHDMAAGPVLVPHWSDSRFRTQLRWKATVDGAVLWWKSPWGRIVGYHARGEVRGAPVRNVVGITIDNQAKIRRKALQWWEAKVSAGAMGRAGIDMMGGVQGNIPPPNTPFVPYKPSPAKPGTWRAERNRLDELMGLRVPTRPVTPLPAAASLTGQQAARAIPGAVWTLQQQVSDFMTRAARAGYVTEGQVNQYVESVGNTTSTGALRELLARLGVREIPYNRDDLLDLLRRQLMERLRGAA
jgi:hypothetical protein